MPWHPCTCTLSCTMKCRAGSCKFLITGDQQHLLLPHHQATSCMLLCSAQRLCVHLQRHRRQVHAQHQLRQPGGCREAVRLHRRPPGQLHQPGGAAGGRLVAVTTCCWSDEPAACCRSLMIRDLNLLKALTTYRSAARWLRGGSRSAAPARPST